MLKDSTNKMLAKILVKNSCTTDYHREMAGSLMPILTGPLIRSMGDLDIKKNEHGYSQMTLALIVMISLY